MNRKQGIRSLVAGLFIFVAARGQGAASEAAGPRNLLGDKRALEAFVDTVVTNRMQGAHVPGAVVTIVKGDRILLNKGYGWANLEQHAPVDPDKTLFRIASVSKVFNAMAVLRLVDEGLIGVDEDVRPRLAAAGLELDNPAAGPVTLKALLTHTAGIRDLHLPDVTRTTDPGQVLPLGVYLKKCLPLRWQAPGESVLYTDHGISLAGYVVEVVAKTRFEEAVRQRVMCPLRMNHSGYVVAEGQRANVAVAYTYGGSGYQATPFLYTSIEPATGVLTTGSDMARLMSCHLSGGKGFLKPETVRLMHQPVYADDARLGVQWTCGFVYETHPRGKEPYLFHIGYAYGFQVVLGISLSRGIGVFVAQNLQGPRVFQLPDLLDGLSGAEAKGGAKPANPSAAADTAERADIQSVVGTYVLNRTLSRGVKIPKEEYVYVRYAADIQGIEVEYWQTRDNPMRLVQVAPFLFRAIKGDDQLSFRTSKDGKRTYLIDYYVRGDGAFRRISPADRATMPEAVAPQ